MGGTMTIDDLATKLDAQGAKLDETLSEIKKLSTWQENLSHHVDELGVAMGAMNVRLTEVEHAINRVSTKVQVPSIPSISGGRVPNMSIE
jgi:hypothetical protein